MPISFNAALLSRLKQERWGYWSLWILVGIVLLIVLAPLWVNHRPLIVRYQGQYYFPIYSGVIPADTFGLADTGEASYRQLQLAWANTKENWLLMPIIPYNPDESDVALGEYPPLPPDWTKRHLLGTDSNGRDVLARVVYSLRSILLLTFIYTISLYVIGMSIGSIMGYCGGKFDLCAQRLIEIWSNIPFLYVMVILSSVLIPNLTTLTIVLILFSWTSITPYFRAITYREKTRDYVAAARVLGASPARILFWHILPHMTTLAITFFPFTFAGAIITITALDFLGFGLPPPTPTIGGLLREGTSALYAPWIVLSAIGALMVLLMLITHIGNSLRRVLDPKASRRYA